ncbi:TPA: Holliday junction resolvase RuvX [Candidatus Poribacteria bacterium]|nr:Holliday junction resolvase RuvX [Candidatus Poribacteria bacterium]
MPRILGLDVGDARIGVSISDELCITAHGLCTIHRRSLKKDIRSVEKIVDEYNVEKIVIGLPKMLSGEIGIQAQKVQRFIFALQKLNIPIITWDERLTTAEAHRILSATDTSRKKRKKVIDQLAASLILDSYLISIR